MRTATRHLHPLWMALCLSVVAAAAIAGESHPVHTVGCYGPDTPGAQARQTARVVSVDHTLTLEFRDADSGALIGVRAGVFDAVGAIPPADPESTLFQSVGGQSYFYCDGQFSIGVPQGSITIRAGKGFDYLPVSTTLVVNSDETVVLYLQRFIDMSALGWYSGDTHAHISHPPINYNITTPQVLMLMHGEDLNFINLMEGQSYFTGVLDPASEPDRLVYYSKEQRNSDMAHLSILGLKQWIPDENCVGLVACVVALNSEIYDQVHAQGDHVLVIGTHPYPTFDIFDYTPWPGGGVWRGMALDLVSKTVDAYDILITTGARPPASLTDYYHALNGGFRIPPSAGTDAGIASGATRAPGGYRVYVSPPDNAALTFEGWVDGLKAGRCFVSNYPLITRFELGGAEAGGTIYHRGEMIKGAVSVECAMPIEKVEIIGEGRVLKTLYPEAGSDGRSLATNFTIDPAGVHWVAARVTGVWSGWHAIDANGLFAHTGPVYLELSRGDSGPGPGGATQLPATHPRKEAADRFLELLSQIDLLFNGVGDFPNGKANYDAAVAASVDYFKRLYPDPPQPFDLLAPLTIPWPHGETIVGTTTPTFEWASTFDPDPGDSLTYTFMIDTDAGFSNPFVVAGLTDTIYTIPVTDELEDEQMYYWRVQAVDKIGLKGNSVPNPSTLRVDLTATGTGEDSPRRWSLSNVWPNPFNPTVQLEYVVPAPGVLSLDIYDAGGRHVRQLFRGRRGAGVYRAAWDGRTKDGTRAR